MTSSSWAAAICLLLMAAGAGRAQEGEVAGPPLGEGADLAAELPEAWRGSCALVVVTSDEQGRPLPGVAVDLRLGESDSVLRGLTTDESGKLSISGLAAGEWQVELRREGFMLYSAYIKLEPGKEPDVGFKSRQRTGSFWAPLEAVFLSAEDAVTPAVRAGRRSAKEAERDARREARREEEARRREERRVERGRAARLVASPEPEETRPEELEPAEVPRREAAGEAARDGGSQPRADDSSRSAPRPPERDEPRPERGADAESRPEDERAAAPASVDRAAASRPEPALPPAAPAPRRSDAPAAPRLLPNPDLLPAGACPECRPGEWSVATEGVAAAAGNCDSSPVEPVIERAAAALAEHLQGPLAAFAGALSAKDANDALRLLPDGLEQELRELLEPVAGEGTSCPVVAVVLPAGARYVGFRYAAAQRSGMAECPPGQGCLIGEASWRGNPDIVEAGALKVVWARFENAHAQRERTPRLTVYFEPERSWLPPSR